jgi:hypothetical protein
MQIPQTLSRIIFQPIISASVSLPLLSESNRALQIITELFQAPSSADFWQPILNQLASLTRPLSRSQPTKQSSLYLSVSLSEQPSIQDSPTNFFKHHPAPDSWQPILNQQASLPKTPVPKCNKNPCPAVTKPSSLSISVPLSQSNRAFNIILPETFSRTQQCRFLTTHSQPTNILNKNPYSESPRHYPRPPSKSLCLCLSPLCTSLYVLWTQSSSLFFYVTERA